MPPRWRLLALLIDAEIALHIAYVLSLGNLIPRRRAGVITADRFPRISKALHAVSQYPGADADAGARVEQVTHGDPEMRKRRQVNGIDLHQPDGAIAISEDRPYRIRPASRLFPRQGLQQGCIDLKIRCGKLPAVCLACAGCKKQQEQEFHDLNFLDVETKKYRRPEGIF